MRIKDPGRGGGCAPHLTSENDTKSATLAQYECPAEHMNVLQKKAQAFVLICSASPTQQTPHNVSPLQDNIMSCTQGQTFVSTLRVWLARSVRGENQFVLQTYQDTAPFAEATSAARTAAVAADEDTAASPSGSASKRRRRTAARASDCGSAQESSERGEAGGSADSSVPSCSESDDDEALAQKACPLISHRHEIALLHSLHLQNRLLCMLGV